MDLNNVEYKNKCSVLIEMIDKLSTVAEKVVLLGNGAGAHVVGYIRSIDSPYSYEVQPIALIYQLGIWWIIYIFCFFVFLFYWATKIIKERYFYERITTSTDTRNSRRLLL